MRAKRIYEFNRGQDVKKSLDVGRHSRQRREQMYKDLEKRGVRMWLGWSGESEETVREFIISDERFPDLYDVLIKEVPPSDFEFSDVQVSRGGVKVKRLYEVRHSNRVIYATFSLAAAQRIVDTMNDYSPEAPIRNDKYPLIAVQRDGDSSYMDLSDNGLELLRWNLRISKDGKGNEFKTLSDLEEEYYKKREEFYANIGKTETDDI